MEARARADLFSETAERMNVAEAIIEKDFWVCWVLKQLFSNKAFEGKLLFKGGTSLSKIFKAINRFSEDIDLAVDYETLGFNGENDPRQENISNKKRNKILGEMMEECQRYIGGEFLDLLGKQCRETLGAGHGWGLEGGRCRVAIFAPAWRLLLHRYRARHRQAKSGSGVRALGTCCRGAAHGGWFR